MHIKSGAKNRILRKLKSKEGSSIVFALLLMLVVIMVSAAVVMASVAAAKKTASDKQSKQDYLTLSSAAQVLRDSICEDSNGFQLVFLEEQEDDKTWKLVNCEINAPVPSGTFAEYINEGLTFLTDLDNVDKIYDFKNSNPFTIENGTVDTVIMNLSMEAIAVNGSDTYKTYQLTADLAIKDSSGNERYCMKLMMEALFSTPPTTITNGSIRTTTISYDWDSLNATIE